MTTRASAYDNAQFLAATEGAAFYNSHAGRLKAVGADGLDLLNRMSTNAVVDLQPGEGAPTILTTDRGRILDILGVVNLGDYVLLLTSSGRQEAVIEWLDRYTIMEDLEIFDITGETAMLTVLGPSAADAIAKAMDVNVADVPSHHSVVTEAGGRVVTVINRPQGMLSGFDIVLSPEDLDAVADALAGAGIVAINEDSYQITRICAAIPEYGREMGDAYNPLEAGLIGGVDFEKGCYIGQEVIARLDTYNKVQKRLVTLRLPEGSEDVSGATLRHEGRDVGVVTSAARNPSTGEVTGLGYARSAHAGVGALLEIGESGAMAEVTGLPQFFGPGQFEDA